MRTSEAKYAYIAVVDGVCCGACADTKDDMTAEFVAENIKAGAEIHRVPVETARTSLFEPWPQPEQKP